MSDNEENLILPTGRQDGKCDFAGEQEIDTAAMLTLLGDHSLVRHKLYYCVNTRIVSLPGVLAENGHILGKHVRFCCVSDKSCPIYHISR